MERKRGSRNVTRSREDPGRESWDVAVDTKPNSTSGKTGKEEKKGPAYYLISGRRGGILD